MELMAVSIRKFGIIERLCFILSSCWGHSDLCPLKTSVPCRKKKKTLIESIMFDVGVGYT